MLSIIEYNLLYYLPFSVSIDFIVALASGIVCTFGVELLAIVVLAMAVVEVVVAPVLAIVMEECMQYGIVALHGRKGIIFYLCM